MKILSNSTKSGFSLIELSVVIIVIGILVIGVTKGSTILNKARIKSAQNLTHSSAVNSMIGLVAWFDASSAESIKTSTIENEATTEYGNIADGDFVSGWKSINPLSTKKFEAIARASDSYRPTYTKDGINNLPSISFDGTDALSTLGDAPVSSGNDTSTFVVVWKKNTTAPTIMLSQNASDGTNYQGVSILNRDGAIGFYDELRTTTVIYGATQPNVPYITILRVDNNNTKNIKMFHNSDTEVSFASPNRTLLNISNHSLIIGGRFPTTNSLRLNGYISEVIVFNRALKKSEIISINTYLSKKYAIKVS